MERTLIVDDMKEVESIKKEIGLFENGIKRCEEQLEFINKKIEENKI